MRRARRRLPLLLELQLAGMLRTAVGNEALRRGETTDGGHEAETEEGETDRAREAEAGIEGMAVITLHLRLRQVGSLLCRRQDGRLPRMIAMVDILLRHLTTIHRHLVLSTLLRLVTTAAGAPVLGLVGGEAGRALVTAVIITATEEGTSAALQVEQAQLQVVAAVGKITTRRTTPPTTASLSMECLSQRRGWI
jgi:hypothetical protein